MSVTAARDALAGAIVGATPSTLLQGRFVHHGGRGEAPLEKIAGAKGRAFAFRTQSPPVDSGLAAATIAQWRAVWEVWTSYPCPPTADRERTEIAIHEDLHAVARAVLPPSVWLPHLDMCAPGQPRIVEVVGTQGEAVALLGVLPLSVLYRS